MKSASLILALSFLPTFLLGNDTLTISNVNVVAMTDDAIQFRRHVRLVDGVIESIRKQPFDRHQGATIDGKGKYLTPGWAEMHAHIPTPQDGNNDIVLETLFLYLSQGITTIRGMLGDPYHLELRQEVQTQDVMSPRIYTSSPSLNGNTLPSMEKARELVTNYARDGYDFLKVHPGIQRDVFDQMVETAREVGITFSGHVPAAVGIEHAIAAGYASIDHLDGYVEGLAPEEMRDQGGFFGILLADHLDHNRIDPLVQQTLQQKIGIVPTQTLFTRWLAPHQLENQMLDPEMAYISPALRYSWRQGKQRMLDGLTFDEEQYDRFLQTRQELIRKMLDHGVTILLGSDAPQVMNVPGFSIHREMVTMADAGMTPYEILQSGTVNVARFFDVESERGTIEPGKIADLVLLNQNPLEDISACSDISAVIYRGHVLDAQTIAVKLAQIAHKYEEQ